MSSTHDLAGRVAIVTGGANGIGAATVTTLAAAGAKVVIADVMAEKSQELERRVTESGGTALAVQTDVSDESSIEALIGTTIEAFGRIDVLHNNAALLNFPNSNDGAVTSVQVADWDRLYAVNVRGVMLGCKHAIPHLIQSGHGSIINTSSSAHSLGDLRSGYPSAKGAVTALTFAIAAQYGKAGVRCNAIAPGLMLHENNEGKVGGAEAMFLKHTLLNRNGTAQDIADAVLFLASDEASFITGQVLGVDGGLATHQPYVGDILEAAAGRG